MSHTKGMLHLAGFRLYAGNTPVGCAHVPSPETATAEHLENARRLVACWNACAGISTEDLEITQDWAAAGIATATTLRAEIARLQAERDALRSVCAEAYQMAGALGAPVKALDNLSAAANGDPLPHETFLPVETPDWNAQRDELLKALQRYVDHFGDPLQCARAAIASATKDQA